MNTSTQRAILLYEQGRHADAERELRGTLAADPNDAFGHALLALCIARRRGAGSPDLAEATAAADRAVGLAPYLPFTHYARAKVLADRNLYAPAEQAIGEAIRLDPANADYWGLLGSLHFDQRRWPAALDAAERGLATDPEHEWCVNLRAMALVKLGRQAEAGAAIGGALARDPNSAVTHANQGWALLHAGEHRPAMEHFREALRIDPELEWARAGMVESLKARHLVYRLMLRYFLFMSRLSGGAQWGILIGGYVLNRVLADAARSNPGLAPLVLPVLVAYLGFALMTWLADPLFNLLLRLSRFGRFVLSARQRVAANVIGGLLAVAVVALVVALARGGDDAWLQLALVTGLLMVPASGAFRLSPGWPTVVMAVAACGLAVVGLGSTALLFAAGGATRGPLVALSDRLFTPFLYGVLFASFGYNYLRSVEPTK